MQGDSKAAAEPTAEEQPQHLLGICGWAAAPQLLLGLVGPQTCQGSPWTLSPAAVQSWSKLIPQWGEPGHRGVSADGAGGADGGQEGPALSSVPAQTQECCTGKQQDRSLPLNRRGQEEHSVGRSTVWAAGAHMVPQAACLPTVPCLPASAHGGAQHGQGPGAQTGSAWGTHSCRIWDL